MAVAQASAEYPWLLDKLHLSSQETSLAQVSAVEYWARFHNGLVQVHQDYLRKQQIYPAAMWKGESMKPCVRRFAMVANN